MIRHVDINRTWLWISLSVVVTLLGLSDHVEAMHEVDHRFTVFGTVLDGSHFPGKPLAGQEVEVRLVKTQKVLQQAVTNEQGLFSVVIHAHNQDRGKQIVVQARNSQVTITLEFDPDDTKTERRARVDLVVFPGSR